MKRRAEFKAVAKGRRVSTERFTLQARRRPDMPSAPRVGLTVTKKTGNAVVRSRIKRRFRVLCAELAGAFSSQTDYVLVARRAALTAPYPVLIDDLRGALLAVEARLAADAAGRAHRTEAEKTG